MRRTDETPIDPQIAAELDAIDATLAGDPVDPQYAELAELALLLAAERPQPAPSFAAALDERVQRKFAVAPDRPSFPRAPVVTRWFAPLAGLTTAGVAAIVAILVVGSLGGGPSRSSSAGQGARTVTAAGSSSGSGSGGASRTAGRNGADVAHSGSASSAAPVTPFGATAGANVPAPQPQPNGRKIVQGAQLALSTRPTRIDTVATEVFQVVGRQRGVVNSSQVSTGAGGYAQFELSVPSSGLGQTMTALSTLRYASVSSRTDSTLDVNSQYLSDQRRLADARALRTSLLRQLAGAKTQPQIESLKAQIRDAEASIRSDEATLRTLNHQIGFSRISLTINPAPAVVAHGHSGSFGIDKAAHDAGRVLTVAAGVALITLAALVPLVLIGLLGWWIAATIQRRRREHALDVA